MAAGAGLVPFACVANSCIRLLKDVSRWVRRQAFEAGSLTCLRFGMLAAPNDGSISRAMKLEHPVGLSEFVAEDEHYWALSAVDVFACHQL